MQQPLWVIAVAWMVGCGGSSEAAPDAPDAMTPPPGEAPLDGAPAPAPARTLAVGSDHACAVVSGTVRCWGSNGRGQLGDGSTTSRTGPVTVPGLTDVVEVAAGDGHTCARTAGGAVHCWGSDAGKQLGYETTTVCGPARCSTQPKPLGGLPSAVRVAAGSQRTCVLGGDGSVRCFGMGGPWDAPLSNHHDVGIDGNAGVCTIAAPERVVRCWSGGALGAPRLVPRKGGGVQTGFARLSLGVEKAGVLDDGSMVGWDAARLPSLGKILDLGTGSAFGCALLEDGAAVCWGNNGTGALGRPGASSDTPVSVGRIATMQELAVGRDVTCARNADGVWCWGSNFGGVVSPSGTPGTTGPSRISL